MADLGRDVRTALRSCFLKLKSITIHRGFLFFSLKEKNRQCLKSCFICISG